MADTTKFWNRFADRYVASPIKDQAAYDQKLALTQAWFTPETDVLEFGAGSGATAIRHAPHVKHIHAIDYSIKMVASARKRAEAEKITNISFDVASIEDFPEDKQFDAVLGLSIVHLLIDRDKVLAKVNRLLRPGGIFVQSTTCLGRYSPLRFLIAPGAALGLLPRVGFFTVEEVLSEMDSAGFTIGSHWHPKPNAAHFIIAKKPGDEAKISAPQS
jgi:ubiquinone/menaquinone biosynthesis C-methylase UbiE